MRTRRMPRIASIAAVLSLVAACSSGATTVDPYQVLASATQATRSPVQVNVGASVKDGTATVTIDPAALGVVIDRDAGTAAIHVSLPAGSLGIDAATLSQLGVTGSTVDLDVLFDGQALYGRSPLFATVLTMLLGSSGDLPSGDLTGWLRFGTKDDLTSLGSMVGGPSAMPSFAVPSPGDAASMKSTLEAEGITFTYVATEKHDGVDAYHLTAAVDTTKLLSSPTLDSISQTQRDQATTALKDVTISGDVWVEKSSSHVIEVDVHVVGAKDATQTADFTVKLGTPDGSISTTAPGTYVDVPLKSIVSNLTKLIGQGLSGA
jgi:hypothetical protein